MPSSPRLSGQEVRQLQGHQADCDVLQHHGTRQTNGKQSRANRIPRRATAISLLVPRLDREGDSEEDQQQQGKRQRNHGRRKDRSRRQ